MASRNGSGFALERADGGIEVYPEATKTGYSLSKWVDSDGNELSIHSIEDEKTFYASWIDDIPPTMTVEVTNDFAREQTISISAVDEGSGVAGYYIGTDNPEETAVTYGDIVNMTVSETGTYYCSSIDIDGNVATEQIIFFAFTFDANGGSTVCERIIVQSGRKVELAAPSKPGYSASWIEDSTGEVVTTVIADGDKSFTANYVDDIAPTFSVSITDDIASSQSFALSATDEGSGVLGFYFGVSDPAQNVVTYTDVTNGVIDASGTYYFAVSDNAGNVVVESYKFHVFTLNANDSMDVLLAGGIEFTLPDVSKTGYSYVWVEDSTGSVVTSSVVDADKSFTAQYTANQYLVTFDANGGVFEDGTSSCEKTVTYDDEYGELPVPTRDGYTFLGWYTEAAGGEEILRETKVSLLNTCTLYAQWEKILVKTLIYSGLLGMDYGVGAYKTLYTNNTDEAQTVMYELSVSSSELYYTWMWLSDTPSSIASDASSTGMRPKVYHGSSYSETLTLPAGWCIGFGEYYCNGTVKLYVWK